MAAAQRAAAYASDVAAVAITSATHADRAVTRSRALALVVTTTRLNLPPHGHLAQEAMTMIEWVPAPRLVSVDGDMAVVDAEHAATRRRVRDASANLDIGANRRPTRPSAGARDPGPGAGGLLGNLGTARDSGGGGLLGNLGARRGGGNGGLLGHLFEPPAGPPLFDRGPEIAGIGLWGWPKLPIPSALSPTDWPAPLPPPTSSSDNWKQDESVLSDRGRFNWVETPNGGLLAVHPNGNDVDWVETPSGGLLAVPKPPIESVVATVGLSGSHKRRSFCRIRAAECSTNGSSVV